MSIETIIETLYNLPKYAIYAFINEENRNVYMGYSKDLILSLHRNIRAMQLNQHVCSKDRNKLQLKIIEVLETDKDIRVRYRYWLEKYISMGYIPYRNFKGINYRVKSSIGLIPSDSIREYGIYVKLVSNGRLERIVGIFKSVVESEEFINKHYSSFPITNIIYADNDYTRKYYEN